MIENRIAMAKNIKKFMELKGVNSSDVCKALKIKHNTFSNWINAKYYPRIDKIELMANYFGVSKSDLVEEHNGLSLTVTTEWEEATPDDLLEAITDLCKTMTQEQKSEVLSFATYIKERK